MKRLLIVALLLGALPALADTCGKDTSTGTVDSTHTTSNYMIADSCTTGTNGGGYTVSSCSLYTHGSQPAGVHWQCAVYTDSGGAPGALLCSGSSGTTTLVANSWNTITLIGCGTLGASTKYHIVFNRDGNVYSPHASVTNYYKAQTYGSWPSSFGSGSSWSYQWSIYISLTPVSAARRKPPVVTGS